ncbi:TPA: hypothetical protein JAD47_003697 [Proteus mirabilis]|nr:hypothetical protein [Proteus mirabilis]HAT5587288.1 hypothetical protein [Proteus mirabilis]
MTDKTEAKELMLADISFRDYLAAEAMNADLSNSDESLAGYGSQFTDAQLESFASFYYRMADAMLKARG